MRCPPPHIPLWNMKPSMPTSWAPPVIIHRQWGAEIICKLAQWKNNKRTKSEEAGMGSLKKKDPCLSRQGTARPLQLHPCAAQDTGLPVGSRRLMLIWQKDFDTTPCEDRATISSTPGNRRERWTAKASFSGLAYWAPYPSHFYH